LCVYINLWNVVLTVAALFVEICSRSVTSHRGSIQKPVYLTTVDVYRTRT